MDRAEPRLVPGWDPRLEPKSARSYFINYFAKNASLDDPRIKNLIAQMDKVHFQEEGKSGRQVPLMGASAMQTAAAAAVQATSVAEAVARIRAMFPTVPETHIKALLIKYLKSVFPVVEETVLLDTLCSADNNVTHATERLLTMGFDKRDTPPPRVSLRKKEAAAQKPPAPKVPPPPRVRSVQEKQTIKARMCSQHPEVAERVVSLALDSADYNEQTAQTILSLMLEDKRKPRKVDSGEMECSHIIQGGGDTITEAVPMIPVSPIIISPRQRLKEKNDQRDLTDECRTENVGFISPLLTKPKGPNKSLPRGPDDSLLLEDYVTWIGARRGLARGPARGLAGGSRGALGNDPSLRKGPCLDLAKGSIYAALRLPPQPDPTRGQ